MNTLTHCTEKVQNFQNRLQFNQDLQNQLNQKLIQSRKKIDEIKESQRLLHFISERVNQSSEQIIARLGSIALQETFYDQDLALEVEHTTARGQPAVILQLRDRRRGVSGDVCDSFGGGPGALLGVVLRVLAIIRQPQLQRLLILDEPLIQVSGRYQERAAALLRKLCDPLEHGGLGFEMLVITHNPVIKRIAHRYYSAVVDEDGSSLKLIEEDRFDSNTEI